MNKGLLIFDLDGTLLNSQKVITQHTLEIVNQCKENGYWIAISTSRSLVSTKMLIEGIHYDFLITSSGALILKEDKIIYQEVIHNQTISQMISDARRICGKEVEISVDTYDHHYWNYHIDPTLDDSSWQETIWDDFTNFNEDGLKVCIEINDENHVEQFKHLYPDLDMIRFIDSNWYKFTKKKITKESALKIIHDLYAIDYEQMIAFGDDLVDLNMLKIVGTGIAMNNAVYEVKEAADNITKSNDEDGVAYYLENYILK